MPNQTICDDIISFLKDVFPYGIELLSCEDGSIEDSTVAKYRIKVQPVDALKKIQDRFREAFFPDHYEDVYSDIDDSDYGDWVTFWTRVVEDTHKESHLEDVPL